MRDSRVTGKRSGIDDEISVSLVVSKLSLRGYGSRGLRDRGVHLDRRERQEYRVEEIQEEEVREVAKEESVDMELDESAVYLAVSSEIITYVDKIVEIHRNTETRWTVERFDDTFPTEFFKHFDSLNR